MIRHRYRLQIACLIIPLWAALIGQPGLAEDWPTWGKDADRNMVAPSAQGLPTDIDPGRFASGSEQIDPETTRNVKWVAKLGSQAYGNPVVADGRVYVGTNNQVPRDPRHMGDRANLYCLDEQTGELIWQYVAPKLGAGKVSDWEFLGLCSSPAVEGDRLYLVSNRCEVVCLDVKGLADGNDGPFTDEAQYLAGPGKPPVSPGKLDADILWVYDMRRELGVFPHNIASNSPLVVGDLVYVATSNGVDWSHTNIPNPNAPALIALDKNTGQLKGEEVSGVSRRTLHCNWSSPAYAVIDGKPMLFWGGGDGYAYAFDPIPVQDEDGFGVLKEFWRVDLNPDQYRIDQRGRPIKYATAPGPSEAIATPVIYEGRLYLTIGQDPEHGEGVGALTCIDPATGEILWRNLQIDRSISTVAAADGLVYAADYAGDLWCFNAQTGELHWRSYTDAHVWGSPLIADGKVWIGNEDGELLIFHHGRDMKLLNRLYLHAPIYSSAIVANDVLYIASQTHLYAIASTE